VKWRPRAELVVDGTLNPDFSQVELDTPQLAGNSRFALFFTEKRPFFFESADLLRTPTEALYTRSFTQPRAGLRATWRDSHWAGSGFAIRDEGGGVVLIPGAFGTGFAEQPGSDSLTLRARRDDGRLLYGGIASARRYADGRGENQVLGPDLGWQFAPQWRLRAQWLHARSTAQPDANGGLGLANTTSGNRVRLRVQRQGGDGETSLGIDDISAGFRHDSGFVNQAGVRRLEAFQSVGWRNLGPFNEFFLNTEAYQVRDRTSGRVVEEVVRPGLWSSASRNLEWWFELFVHSRLRTSADAPLLAQRFIDTGLVMTPAPWMPLLETSIEYGRVADTAAGPLVGGVPTGLLGTGGEFEFFSRLRLLAPLELEPRIKHAWIRRDGQTAYQETAEQLLAVWHFNARHNLRLILQRSSLERGGIEAASPRTESLTYAWRFSAGTRLYLGATRSRVGGDVQSDRREAFLKIEVDADDVGAALRRAP
jgi:hypothetical protein